MADQNMIVAGLIVTLFMGIMLVSPLVVEAFNSILRFDSDKLTTLITIVFFAGIGTIVIGAISSPRNNRR